MRSIKEGDVVILKSGGLPMTVKTIDIFNNKEGALCEWFSKDNKLERAVFLEHQLELVKSSADK
ncbi:MAG: DUF2158 domain-containing protein [Acidobacteriota bacterium]